MCVGGSGRTAGRCCFRVRWGRPLLSRPRRAVGSGPAAVESAAVSAVALTCGFNVFVSLDGYDVRLCLPRVPVCARVRPCVPCVCPGSPRCLFTGTVCESDVLNGENGVKVGPKGDLELVKFASVYAGPVSLVSK